MTKGSANGSAHVHDIRQEPESDPEPAHMDARGVPIPVGATCLYGAGVGRSIALVEGVIEGFTASGRVWVRVVRRAYGGYGEGAERVHVGADRLAVVEQLPRSPLDTEATKSAAYRVKLEEYRSTGVWPR